MAVLTTHSLGPQAGRPTRLTLSIRPILSIRRRRRRRQALSGPRTPSPWPLEALFLLVATTSLVLPVTRTKVPPGGHLTALPLAAPRGMSYMGTAYILMAGTPARTELTGLTLMLTPGLSWGSSTLIRRHLRSALAAVHPRESESFWLSIEALQVQVKRARQSCTQLLME